MSTLIRNACAGLIGLLLVAGNAAAIPVPPGFNPDDGTELFTPDGQLLSIELFDIADALGATSGLAFGFYFAADPGTLIEIMDVADVTPSSALIDFASGVVADLDEGGTLQTVFTPAVGPIGFYLQGPAGTLFTQSLLNGGLDVAETFSAIGATPTSYLIGFEVPNAGTPDILLGLNLVVGVTRVAEPASTGLLMLGLLFAGIGAAAQRARGSKAA